jgi:hypothetical protein
MPRLSHALVFAFFAAACSNSSSSGGRDAGSSGGSGNAGAPGSCAHGKNSCTPGTDFCCADYGGLFTAVQVRSDCDDPRVAGEYSPDPCTTESLEASCTLYKGTAAEKIIRYYQGYDQLSQSDPPTNCSALHGFFEAAPP